MWGEMKLLDKKFYIVPRTSQFLLKFIFIHESDKKPKLQNKDVKIYFLYNMGI